MPHSWYRFLCLLILTVVVFVPPVLAANGKIVGVVRDATTKEVIPGANVLIVGTTLGGSADVQGRYFILNVPPGTYTLQVSAVGFARLRVEGVSVVFDQTVEINSSLQSPFCGLPGQTVTAV